MPLMTSAAARRSIATNTWGEVQSARRLSADASFYNTATHGGIVAVLPPVPNTDAWRALRETLYREHLVEEVHRFPVSSSRHRYLIARHWHFQHARSSQRWDLLIGEEDCAWSIVVLVLDALGVALDLNAGMSERLPHRDRIYQAREIAGTWYPDLLVKLDAAAAVAR